MNHGEVKWFNNKKGYGFITGEDGKDVFVHYKNIAMDGFKTLKPDQKVVYEVVNKDKGLEALNVTVEE